MRKGRGNNAPLLEEKYLFKMSSLKSKKLQHVHSQQTSFLVFVLPGSDSKDHHPPKPFTVIPMKMTDYRVIRSVVFKFHFSFKL